MAQKFLVVDDEAVFRGRLAKALRARGYEVDEAGGVAEAQAALAHHDYDRMLVDLKMPGASGMELLEHAQGLASAPEIVVLTGFGSIASAVAAMRNGALHYLLKPVAIDEILAAFERGDPTPGEGLAVLDAAQHEWEHINHVLEAHGGNVSKTAKALGMHRRSLQRKLARPPQSLR